MVIFFFVKQKSADEMRISDWSSDVCSSDLLSGLGPGGGQAGAVHDVVEAALEHLEHELAGDALATVRLLVEVAELALGQAVGEAGLLLLLELGEAIGRASCRARVCQHV